MDETRDDHHDAESFFAANGPLARAVGNYSPRPQQVEMANAVEAAVTKRHALVVEAGTGVGKSFGYLVPVLLHGLEQGRRIVVSTHTISLQEQLIEKDLPLLWSVMPRRFRASVAKGRSNYLAPRRLEVATSQAQESSGGEAWYAALSKIADWAETQDEGSRQQLVPPPEPDIWEQVQSEHGNCLGDACEFFESTCFYHIARRRLSSADLIVVNHSLLLADVVLRRQGAKLLPDYDILVVDEAHTLEAVAMDHFGARLTRRMVQLLLARLHHPSQRRGFLVGKKGAEDAARLVHAANSAAAEFFEHVVDYCGGPSMTREIDGRQPIADPLSIALDALAAELTALKSESMSKEVEIELQNYIRRLVELREMLAHVLSPVGADHVHWAEVAPEKRGVELHSKPLEVAPNLQAELFANVGTVVLTSATLSVRKNGGLDWFAKSLGIPEAQKLQVGSPFDYQKNVTLRVPTYLDEPRPSGDYEERAANSIQRYVERAQGGAFVLCTSYEFMRRMARRLEERFRALGFPVFVQGEGLPRGMMVEEFKRSDHSVLFGTDSFWQGVDVQGEKLRLVIITRLPFPVPTQPLVRARSERIRARGGDPFKELSLPEAIIKFKQGFGRLVRTETDRGTVVVLDTRLVTKGYGRQFRDAIPPLPLIED